MAKGDGRGGYRRPAQPAPVSGPGRLSRRTDGGPAQGARDLPDAAYGEQADYQNIQQGAAMAATPPNPPPSLDEPTQRPDEPITAGAPSGDGVGPEAAGIQMDLGQADAENMRGLLYSLEVMSNLPGSNPSTRALVRSLKARIP